MFCVIIKSLKGKPLFSPEEIAYLFLSLFVVRHSAGVASAEPYG